MSKTYSKLCDMIVESPFYTAPRNHKIDTIIPHHMAGNLSAHLCGEWFQNPSARCSSNAGIGSDGKIAGYVPEEYRAWTTGNQIDHRAYTIEIADDGKNPWHTSDNALQSAIRLIADVCKRYGIKQLVYTGDKNGNLQMHKWYQNTDCPGSYLESKFPYIAREVNKILNGKTTYDGAFPAKIPARGWFRLGDGYDRLTSYKPQIKRVQRFLNWALNDNLAIDGCYGAKTKASCLRFQKKAGMKNTRGNWGTRTQKLAEKFKA